MNAPKKETSKIKYIYVICFIHFFFPKYGSTLQIILSAVNTKP